MLRSLQRWVVRKWYGQLWQEHSGTQLLAETPTSSALKPTSLSPLPKAQHKPGIRDCVLRKGQGEGDDCGSTFASHYVPISHTTWQDPCRKRMVCFQ